MNLVWRGITVLSVLSASLLAQIDDEAGFLARQATVLDKHAEAAFKAGYPSMARLLWLEVLAEYDKDHANTRKRLGFDKFRSTWAPRQGFVYPEGDNPSAAAARKIESRWGGVARGIGGAHKTIAGEFRAAGRADRAAYHFGRALRFLPDDEEVRAAMGHKQFEGNSGTAIEETLFNRSKQMAALVTREMKQDYPVTAVTDAPPAWVTKVGIECICAKSEHFTIWGEWPEPVLTQAAKNAERAFAFCKEAFVGSDSFKPDNVRSWSMVFVKGRGQFKKVLEASPDLLPDAGQRKFILDTKSVTMTAIRLGGKTVRFGGPNFEQVLNDAAVRFVVQEFSAMRSDGLQEGIGHAVVGMFFGQNLIFSVAQDKGNTVTNSQRKLLLPDMDTWVELAIEAAFNPRGTKAARLPLMKASQFPTDGRIKAWSFCDYLMRRDPTLLLRLDLTRSEKNEAAVGQKFAAAAGVSLDALEQEWKDFWTGATPVLRALRLKQPVLYSVSKDAGKWLKSFNKARREAITEAGWPVDVDITWNAGYSQRCKQHAEYLAANRTERGPIEEHRQQDGKVGATLAGSAFAAMALVSTKGAPARAMQDWIHIPGYRDALINPYLRTAGVYAQGSIAVIDVLRGAEFPAKVNGRTYPANNKKDVPREIAVKLLGPEIQAALSERGIKASSIGYPLTYHSWRAGGVPADAVAKVTCGGKPLDGLVIVHGRNRITAAPGMMTFYPLAPLKPGLPIRAAFTSGDGSKALASWGFQCK